MPDLLPRRPTCPDAWPALRHPTTQWEKVLISAAVLTLFSLGGAFGSGRPRGKWTVGRGCHRRASRSGGFSDARFARWGHGCALWRGWVGLVDSFVGRGGIYLQDVFRENKARMAAHALASGNLTHLHTAVHSPLRLILTDLEPHLGAQGGLSASALRSLLFIICLIRAGGGRGNSIGHEMLAGSLSLE